MRRVNGHAAEEIDRLTRCARVDVRLLVHKRNPLVELVAQLGSSVIGSEQAVGTESIFSERGIHAVSQVERPPGLAAIGLSPKDAREREAPLDKSALSHHRLESCLNSFSSNTGKWDHAASEACGCADCRPAAKVSENVIELPMK